MTEILQRLSRDGIETVRLTVEPANRAAILLYRSLGFSPEEPDGVCAGTTSVRASTGGSCGWSSVRARPSHSASPGEPVGSGRRPRRGKQAADVVGADGEGRAHRGEGVPFRGVYGPSARAIRAPWSRIDSRPGPARCGASGSRASCSSMDSPAAQGSPVNRPVSASSASTSAASCSSVQSSTPAARTPAAAVSRAAREPVPPGGEHGEGDGVDGVPQHRGEAGGGGMVQHVGAEVAAAGGALHGRGAHPARQHGQAQHGEPAASGEPLVVAVAAAARAEELPVADGGPRGAGADQAARTPGGSGTAVGSPFWQHVAPPSTPHSSVAALA